MAQTPVITSPSNGASGLGATPRIFGSAEPNHSVNVAITDAGTATVVGTGVAGPTGQWASDLSIAPGKWYIIQAQSYVVKSDPSTYSAWSAPITIAG
jgi:hypothetical protein